MSYMLELITIITICQLYIVEQATSQIGPLWFLRVRVPEREQKIHQ